MISSVDKVKIVLIVGFIALVGAVTIGVKKEVRESANESTVAHVPSVSPEAQSQPTGQAESVAVAANVDVVSAEAIAMPRIDIGLFAFDPATVREWRQSGDHVEAIVDCPERGAPVYVAAELAASGEWIMVESAYLGEYIFFAEDYAEHAGLAAIEPYFSDVTRNPYMVRVRLDVETLAEAARIDRKSVV